MKILYSNTSFVTMIFNISSCSISLCMRVVARSAARAFALTTDLAARVAISRECFWRWRESGERAQFRALAAFWLRRIAGALYATLPDRRANAAVLLGLAWKKLTLRLRAAFFDLSFVSFVRFGSRCSGGVEWGRIVNAL